MTIHTDGFAKRLAEVRRSRGLTQEAFSEIGGVRANAQRNYEGGSRNPDSAYLIALFEAGFDVPYVITGHRTAGDLTADDRLVLHAFRQLSDEARAAVLSMLDVMVSGCLRPQVPHSGTEPYHPKSPTTER